MRPLWLVRHAAVNPLDGVPPEAWRLSGEGTTAAAELAHDPGWGEVALVATSPEPKARDTARPLAAARGAPLREEGGLREVRRRGTPLLPRPAYVELVGRFFAGEPVPGWEPRDEARERIRAAVARALEEAGGPLVVVSHGLVLSLYLASLEGRDVPDLAAWEAIPLPGVTLVDAGAGRLVRPFAGSVPRPGERSGRPPARG